MDPYEPLFSLGLAVAAGLLIGLEREQSAPTDRFTESFLGGARTYPLVALAGALATLLGRHFGAEVVIAAFAAVMIFLVVAYVDVVRRGTDRGITSEAAFLVTFLLGAISVSQDLIPQVGRRVFTVLSTAVVVTALLSSKPIVQPLMRRVSREDVVSVLKFLIVALVLVPWLPDRNFGPLGALNLRVIGWMMLLVAGVGFVGYAATRLLGPERGLTVTGFVGGLVSSTAVTLAMSSRSKGDQAMERPAALAVVLASSIVFLRILVVVAFVNFQLAAAMAIPMFSMAIAGLVACAFLYRHSARHRAGEPLAGFTNTIVKGVMALVLGSWGYARIVVTSFAAILAAGGLSLLAVWR